MADVEDRKTFLEILSATERQELLARSHSHKWGKGQAVLGRGEASSDVYLVQEGRLNVVLYSADGREVSLRDLRVGQLFGELAAIDGAVRSVGIMAATDVRLLVIPQDCFQAALCRCPEANQWMMRRLTAQIRSLTSKVFELSALNVQTRLHCELLRMAKTQGEPNEDDLTHAEIANRIGTHREAVTRELNALAARRFIRTSRRKVEFLDLPGLEREVRSTLRAPIGDGGWW